MPHVFLLQADWSEVVLDSGIGRKTKCTQYSYSSVLSVILGQIVDNLILQKTASDWSRAGLLWDHLFFCSFVWWLITMPRMAQYTGKWLLIASKVKPFPRPGKRNDWSSQSFAWLTLGLVEIIHRILIV